MRTSNLQFSYYDPLGLCMMAKMEHKVGLGEGKNSSKGHRVPSHPFVPKGMISDYYNKIRICMSNLPIEPTRSIQTCSNSFL